jgi:plant G-box-binding factor
MANDRPREPGRLATLANVRIPDATIKPCASTGSDFRVSGTQSTDWPAKVCFKWQLK